MININLALNKFQNDFNNDCSTHRVPAARELLSIVVSSKLENILCQIKSLIDYNHKMVAAGIRRDGVYYYDDNGESYLRWFVVDLNDRTDEKLVEDVSNATRENLFEYGPLLRYDCTRKAIAYGPRLYRGRKIATITQWRGLDV